MAQLNKFITLVRYDKQLATLLSSIILSGIALVCIAITWFDL